MGHVTMLCSLGTQASDPNVQAMAPRVLQWSSLKVQCCDKYLWFNPEVNKQADIFANEAPCSSPEPHVQAIKGVREGVSHATLLTQDQYARHTQQVLIQQA